MGKIVWIASYPRSGNTWVRYFLMTLVGRLRGETAPPDINRLYRFSTWDALNIWWAKPLGKLPSDASKPEVAALRTRVQAEIAAEGPPINFVKTHSLRGRSHGHPTINPAVTAGAVYLVRNPLDIAVSSARYLNLSPEAAVQRLNERGYETFNQGAGVYEPYGSWSENVESWTARGEPVVLVLRYEDLLEKAEESFGRLARHVGLKPPPAALRAAIEASAFARMAEQEKTKTFIERPPSARRFFESGRAGQWQEGLPAELAESIVKAHGPTMRRFGYLTN
ncbi:MAG TPA: sulfotransferase domain-containing protein [Kiloniellales bacterium]|nr:sulfotransferase domain-containing protein [Kiloniellales bacterium]